METARAEAKIFDPYGFLLNNPDQRDIALINKDIEYVGSDFSKDIYEVSRGKVFSTYEDAYRDWVEFGRGEGLCYGKDKDTYLKIIAKVKDESEFISKWIKYHASIVGYHNLIIIDCGSEDPEFLSILDDYKDKLLILKYDGIYTDLHAAGANRDFYMALAKNCKYLSFIDADEFLFGYRDGKFSAQNVISVLKNGQEKIYAGTWFFNSTVVSERDNLMNWNDPLTFSLEPSALRIGTQAGKAVMLSRITLEARHVGHNLHVKNVISFLTPESFGKIGLFHITSLSPRLQRARALKHLRGKGILPPHIVAEPEIEQWLTDALEKGDRPLQVQHYIKKYLNPPPPQNPKLSFTTDILGNGGEHSDENLSRVLTAAYFTKILNESASKFELPTFPDHTP